MCGIFTSVSTCTWNSPCPELQDLLCKRGPDHIGHQKTHILGQDGYQYFISLVSTVLALRGGLLTTQPFVDSSTQSTLCWNGEAWTLGAAQVEGNDGKAVFDALIRASCTPVKGSMATDAVLATLRSISGPFAFVYLDRTHSCIYFGRDRLGRRSLLYKNDSNGIELSSTADSMSGEWKEVEADGIYRISLSEKITPGVSTQSNDHIFSTSVLPIVRYIWDIVDSVVRYYGIRTVLPPMSRALHILTCR